MKKHLFGLDTVSWLDVEQKPKADKKDSSVKSDISCHFYLFQNFDDLSEEAQSLIPKYKLEKIRDQKGPTLVELDSGEHWFFHLNTFARDLSNH